MTNLTARHCQVPGQKGGGVVAGGGGGGREGRGAGAREQNPRFFQKGPWMGGVNKLKHLCSKKRPLFAVSFFYKIF